MRPVDVILPTYITTYSQVEMTLRFCATLYEHAPHARLIWVDNGSGQGAGPVREWLRKQDRPFIDKPQGSNLGFPKAVNIGLRASEAPYLIIANNDVTVMAGSVQMLQAALNAQPDCAVIAPVSNSGWQDWANLDRYVGLAGLQALGRREEYADKAAWLGVAYGDQSVAVCMVAFFFAMLTRGSLQQIGLLDEGYGMGFAEDDDWCERARRIGREVRLALGSFVVHDHRATWNAFMSADELAALQARSAERLEQRRAGGFG